MHWLTSLQLRSRDAGTRARAARKLGVAGRASNAAELEPLLQDAEPAVRCAAIEALGAIGGEAVVPPLLGAARGADAVRAEAEAAAVRASVVAALTAVGQAAVPALLAAAGDRHARVRECSVTALGAIGGQRAAEGLARALADDRSALRQLAARALARTAGAGAVGTLSAALAHKDAATRRAAAEALGDTRADEAVPALQRALADPDRGVQAAVVQALAAVGRGAAIDALIGALCRPDRELRQAAAQALRGAAWTPDGDGQRALHAALHGRFDEVGAAAGVGAGQVDAEPVAKASVELLKASLSDRDAGTRVQAARALGRVGGPRAAGALAAMLGDPDPTAREAAAATLGHLGPAALEAILPGLEDRSATTRAAAGRVLEEVGGGSIAMHLLNRLSPGEAVSHGGLALRVVDRLEALDAARHAADSLERLLRLAGGAVPPAALQRAAALPDVVLIEPGQVPDAGERLDLEDLRELAARTLSGAGPGRGARR